MKLFRTLLACLLVSCLLLAGCANKDTPKDDTSDLTPPEISDNAMNNFWKKIEEGNYTIEGKDFQKISVYSNDYVWVDYVEEGYNDQAVVAKDNEVFLGVLTADGIKNVEFYGEGTAAEAAKAKLPTHWLDVSGGNIYELFTNQVEEPLTFVSNDNYVKETLSGYMGNGEMAISRTEEVYMTMDAMDPTEVQFKAVVNDDESGRHYYNDIDVVIKFGAAESNAAADAWLKDPVLPEARTAWDEVDEFLMNSVFMPGYGLQAVPFPEFASYALKIDEERFLSDETVYIRDCRAEEKNVEDYIDTLIKAGFTKVEEQNEYGEFVTSYRKLLREDTKCYSDITVDYNNGIDITAKPYYDSPRYFGIEEVNSRITAIGYPALKDSDDFNRVDGIDRANASTESWLYFFDYESDLYVDISYKDQEALDQYIADYIAELGKAGYVKVIEGLSEEDAQDEDLEADYYANADGSRNFRYHFGDDGKVTFLFRAKKQMPVADALAQIKEAGFPDIEISENAACRDLRKYYKVKAGVDLDIYLTVGQEFASAEEAEAYLTKYEEKLTELGFGRVSPDTVGANKPIALYNEEKNMVLAIDYFKTETGATVNMDFSA